MKHLRNTLYINQPDRHLSLDGVNVVISCEGEELGRVPLHNLEMIVTFGHAGTTPALMGKCARDGISLVFMSRSGRFLARVEGEIADEQGVFESYLAEDADGYKVRSVAKGAKGAKLAKTEWRRISCERGTTLVEVKLKTGRKNQIRVHFSEAGHPVVGDVKYGGHKAQRLFLHSLRLKFTHPFTGKTLELESKEEMQ